MPHNAHEDVEWSYTASALASFGELTIGREELNEGDEGDADEGEEEEAGSEEDWADVVPFIAVFSLNIQSYSVWISF